VAWASLLPLGVFHCNLYLCLFNTSCLFMWPLFFGLLHPEDYGTAVLQNITTYLPFDTAHIPEDLNLRNHWCENLRSHIPL